MSEMTQRIEEIFDILDQSSTYIAEQLGKTYLDALIDTAEQLFQQEILLDELNQKQVEKLQSIYQEFKEETYSKEEVRRGFQLAVLKGMKAEQVIPGSGVTPDSVVMLVGYLAQKLLEAEKAGSIAPQTEPNDVSELEKETSQGLEKESSQELGKEASKELEDGAGKEERKMTILDPAVGIGNLLTGVCNAISQETRAIGTEVEPVLVRLAYVNANLQQHDVELFHQDGLKPLFIDGCDMIVSDIPVGRYPNDKVARSFALYEEGEDVYTHHLFIEQALRYVKEGGYLLLIIPNFLFEEPGSVRLRSFLMEHAYIQALLQIPQELFQKGSIQKSIFILQKKGDHIKKPKQTLLAQLPSFHNKSKVAEFIQQMNRWIEAEKGDERAKNTGY